MIVILKAIGISTQNKEYYENFELIMKKLRSKWIKYTLFYKLNQ